MGSRRGLRPLSGSTASPGPRKLPPGGDPWRPGRPALWTKFRRRPKDRGLDKVAAASHSAPALSPGLARNTPKLPWKVQGWVQVAL